MRSDIIGASLIWGEIDSSRDVTLRTRKLMIGLATISEKGGEHAQDIDHGTFKFRQPATVSENVTQ
ncbi:MAG: hypothetical protein ACLQPD_35800 [Desulfomonilaceae bacterium]